jgi:hypothetical protein
VEPEYAVWVILPVLLIETATALITLSKAGVTPTILPVIDPRDPYANLTRPVPPTPPVVPPEVVIVPVLVIDPELTRYIVPPLPLPPYEFCPRDEIVPALEILAAEIEIAPPPIPPR